MSEVVSAKSGIPDALYQNCPTVVKYNSERAIVLLPSKIMAKIESARHRIPASFKMPLSKENMETSGYALQIPLNDFLALIFIGHFIFIEM